MKRSMDYLKDEKGSILVLFVMASVALFLITGLAVDLGIAYARRSTLSRAVDAGSLMGTRHTDKTPEEIRKIVRKVAHANFGEKKARDADSHYRVRVVRPGDDSVRIEVTGTTSSPALFSRVIGRDQVDLVAKAEATRFPLDMSLVLDLSYSLQRNNAFDDMQDAAGNFLDYFDDNLDQFGLVTYSTWAEDRMSLRKDFKSTGQSIISGLSPITDTNIEEGLRVSKLQLDTAPLRESALKVVVLFTDGRPTAFADCFDMRSGGQSCQQSRAICHNPGTPVEQTLQVAQSGVSGHLAHGDTLGPCPSDPPSHVNQCRNHSVPPTYEGIVATYISGSSYRGLFQTLGGRKVTGFDDPHCPEITTSNGSGATSPSPTRLPDGSSVNGNNIRRIGAEQSEEWASLIRQNGYAIYSVALGNPNASNEGDRPDLAFLRRIANEGGIVSASQPTGELLFAPTPAELDETFQRLADRIMTRLTQ